MRTLDVPQANDLATVRAIVYAVRQGNLRKDEIVDFTGFSARHAGYRLHAARVLGLVDLDGDVATLTTLGERLIDAPLRSAEATQAWHDAISRSPILQRLAPDLLSKRGPSVETLTERIMEATGASSSTASRRASGLLSWRYSVLGIEPGAGTPPPAPEPEPEPAADPQPAGQLSLFG